MSSKTIYILLFIVGTLIDNGLAEAFEDESNLSEYNEIPMEYQLKGMDSRVVDSEIIKALVEVNSELETNLMDEDSDDMDIARRGRRRGPARRRRHRRRRGLVTNLMDEDSDDMDIARRGRRRGPARRRRHRRRRGLVTNLMDEDSDDMDI